MLSSSGLYYIFKYYLTVLGSLTTTTNIRKQTQKRLAYFSHYHHTDKLSRRLYIVVRIFKLNFHVTPNHAILMQAKRNA